MNKHIFLLPFFAWLLSCNHADKTAPAATAVEPVKTDTFFPVTSYLKGQMLLLDSLQTTPLYTITAGTKTDSFWVKKDTLRQLLQSFISPEITETNLSNYFSQSKFNDQTIGMITFTYKPVKQIPDSIPLRNWDIYIDSASSTIRKVYLVKQVKESAGSITQQLLWQTGKSATITTILNQPSGNSDIIKQEKVIWNFDE